MCSASGRRARAPIHESLADCPRQRTIDAVPDAPRCPPASRKIKGRWTPPEPSNAPATSCHSTASASERQKRMDTARARATRENSVKTDAGRAVDFRIFSPVLVVVLVLLRSGFIQSGQAKQHFGIENKGDNQNRMKADETRFKGGIVF